MKLKEKISKIKLKYPEIREILQKLYTSAYRSGQGIGGKGDGYDHSTAYEEIEKSLDSMRKETLREVEKEIMEDNFHEEIAGGKGWKGDRFIHRQELLNFINNLKTKNE